MFFPHSYAKIKIDTYESLPLEETLPLHNDIIFIISVYNRNKNKNNDNNKNKNENVHIDDIYIYIYMIHYDRTDISEETDVDKTNESKECDFCHMLMKVS